MCHVNVVFVKNIYNYENNVNLVNYITAYKVNRRKF